MANTIATAKATLINVIITEEELEAVRKSGINRESFYLSDENDPSNWINRHSRILHKHIQLECPVKYESKLYDDLVIEGYYEIELNDGYYLCSIVDSRECYNRMQPKQVAFWTRKIYMHKIIF